MPWNDLDMPRVKASALGAFGGGAGWFVVRETVLELVFGSFADWLKGNAIGRFIVDSEWSPLIIGLILFGAIWIAADHIERRKALLPSSPVAVPIKQQQAKAPVTVKVAGIRWEHDGFHPVDSKPKVKATCPKHRTPLFFRSGVGVMDMTASVPTDTDLIGVQGVLICLSGGEHAVMLEGATVNPLSTAFGQLRLLAQALIEPKVKR